MTHIARRTSAGYTLHEVLIAVLIVSVLLGITLTLYLGSVADSQRKACRASMQVIAAAEQAYRMKDANHQYTTNTATLIADGNLASIPPCPVQGANAYTITTDTSGNIAITCSASAHGTFRPGIDRE